MWPRELKSLSNGPILYEKEVSNCTPYGVAAAIRLTLFGIGILVQRRSPTVEAVCPRKSGRTMPTAGLQRNAPRLVQRYSWPHPEYRCSSRARNSWKMAGSMIKIHSTGRKPRPSQASSSSTPISSAFGPIKRVFPQDSQART